MKPAKVLATVAGQGNLEAMRLILTADASLAKEWQPLMEACFYGQAAAAALLLDHGADPNVVSKSSYKYRPLHRTMERKITVPRTQAHVEVVELLLERGADPFLPGAWNQVNALVWIAVAGERLFLEPVLARVPEYDVYTAAALGEVERVRAAVNADASLVGKPDANGWSLLRYCAESRLGEGDAARSEALSAIARLLVEAGADPRGSLDAIVYKNNASLTELFLDHGAEIQDGDTLNHAACDGSFEALNVLARRGVNLNKTEGTEHHGGYVPYGCTLTMKSVRGAQWFLDQGVDPNFVGGDKGESAMHVAVRSGASPALLKLLMERGADPNARDAAGETPLAAARAKAQKSAIEYLTGIGAAD